MEGCPLLFFGDLFMDVITPPSFFVFVLFLFPKGRSKQVFVSCVFDFCPRLAGEGRPWSAAVSKSREAESSKILESSVFPLFKGWIVKEQINPCIIAFFTTFGKTLSVSFAIMGGLLLIPFMPDDLKGLLIIISGPSGVGKGTVIRHLKEMYPQFEYPISHTTRDMRMGEKDGEVYHFITKEAFEKGIENGDFLEYAQVHETNYYGTLKKPIMESLRAGKVVVREVDVQGAQSMKKVVPPENLVTIFLKAENKKDLLSRIAHRGELPPDELKRRMESAERELDVADEFQYEVWSKQNKIPECVADVDEIILKEMEKAGIVPEDL